MIPNPWLNGLVVGGAVLAVLMTLGALASWWERKFSARLQGRVGTTILGPWGILQPFADAAKMIQKEDLIPRDADRVLFYIAPLFPVTLVLGLAAVIPFAGYWADGVWHGAAMVADVDVGVLFVLALSGLMVFPLWMAGWASNNKYSLLAAMRAVAQGVSYEIPMVLAALVPVIASGKLSVTGVIAWQAEHGWIVARLPVVGFLAFVLFYLTSLAEANRIPFDIPEAESELVGGVITEYTGIKSGLFILSEYLHTLVASAVATGMFLGGGHVPGLAGLPIWAQVVISLAAMWFKTLALFVSIYWIRWSWYRFRSDQLMELCWRYLVPGGLGLVASTAVAVSLGWV